MACKAAFLFDTETTGLLRPSIAPRNKQPRLIEIAYVVVRYDKEAKDLNLLDAHQTLINAGVDIPKDVVKKVGINNSMLADAPRWGDVRDKVLKALSECQIAVAHNAAFDMAILRNEEKLHAPNEQWRMATETICTVEQTEHIFGKRVKLEDLFKHCTGRTATNAHRAAADVNMLFHCWRWMCEHIEL